MFMFFSAADLTSICFICIGIPIQHLKEMTSMLQNYEIPNVFVCLDTAECFYFPA